MSLVIPIKTPLKVAHKSKCSFCGETRPCVESLISHKAICYGCHLNAKEIIGAIPVASVPCLHCHKYDNVIVEMHNKSIITYNSPGLDIQYVTLYIPIKFHGNYKQGDKKKQAWCGYCRNEIPLYVLNRSHYIL